MLPQVKKCAFFIQRLYFDPLIISRVISKYSVNCSLSFCVIIALTTNNKQKVSYYCNTMLIPNKTKHHLHSSIQFSARLKKITTQALK